MPVRNVSHIAIGVRDMERSLPFWTDVVGLHVTLDTIEEFKLGGEVVRRRGVYLREREGPDEPFVVLDQQLSRRRRALPSRCSRWGSTTSVSGWTTLMPSTAGPKRPVSR